MTHSSKNAVENHFDTSYELEALLEQRVKRQLLAEVQAICPPGVTIMNVRQAQPLGLGHSILCARPVVGDNPFVVVLPDIILDGGTADPLRYNLAAMVARFNETGRSQVLAKRMPGDLSEYSVIRCALCFGTILTRIFRSTDTVGAQVWLVFPMCKYCYTHRAIVSGN